MTASVLSPIPLSLRVRLGLELQPSQAVAPRPRVLAAGAAALVGSLVAAYLLAELGRALFTVPREFDKFNFGGYAVLTAIGVVVAALGWPLTQKVTARPRWLYLRAAAVVTVVLLLPDIWLFTQAGNPTGPVIALMVMHVAIAVVTYLAMTRLAAAGSGLRQS